ncbi:RdgB/HAM1 family non-canonical purine NTP pyrophosphatase [Criblamydia sequanensis]|uniref:dITP/XTP pyrophosphatase n=1 Tax=Candidatus Criblamydia sequanensis CRIB-18 TaxID=1437425 RepID=A0A090CZS7_9BACT|nr:RdgB/HAM1 family non-canonical purine NTP pyrophosphatase [Criblamydia sequanensis]CDR34496.1 Nucleoside-triphosphatase [Criblamydia sequanensis CRIB-18]
MKIILATSNLHKIREFREMFANLSEIDWLSLLNYPNYKLPEETGSTFEENSAIKALHGASHLNEWVLADDSGLVVPSLGKEPGIFSKRYAGLNANDNENRKKLLEKLSEKKDIERNAYFQCSLTLANKEGVKKTVTSIVEGYIAHEEKGRNGFGYDSLFIKHDYNQTFGELDPKVKSRISHRRKAFEKLLPTLHAILRSESVSCSS